MEIRKYQAEDRATLQRICILTAPPQKSEAMERVLLLMYNDYYTEYESENCFVLDDGDGNAVGYILISADFKNYKKTFKKAFLPRLKEISFSQYLLKKLSFLPESIISRKYPAHLHIDILSDFTGNGEGGKLMKAALEYLAEKRVKGIFLCVGSHNKGAVRFYRRNGFKIKLRIPGAYYMVRKV